MDRACLSLAVVVAVVLPLTACSDSQESVQAPRCSDPAPATPFRPSLAGATRAFVERGGELFVIGPDSRRLAHLRGARWETLDIAGGHDEATALAADAAGQLYATTVARAPKFQYVTTLWASDDGGHAWRALFRDPDGHSSPGGVAVGGGVIALSLVDNVRLSGDGGATWRSFDVEVEQVVVADDGVVYATDRAGGLHRGGPSGFETIGDGKDFGLFLATAGDAVYRSQDTGGRASIDRSDDHGASWTTALELSLAGDGTGCQETPFLELSGIAANRAGRVVATAAVEQNDVCDYQRTALFDSAASGASKKVVETSDYSGSLVAGPSLLPDDSILTSVASEFYLLGCR